MHDFKVGDRVVYKATSVTRSSDHEGRKGVVTEIKSADAVGVGWDESSLFNRGGYLIVNLRHLPAPDVITIDRADLPEVVVAPAGHYLIAGDQRGKHATAEGCRESARISLALAEFLEAREKAAEEAKAAEKEAAELLNKRRDELAKEVAKRACYVNYQNFTYEDHVPATQAAINMFIELEDPRG